MATSTPFARVSVNRFGFNILDVRINLVNTEEPMKMAVMLVAMTCACQDNQDDLEWIETQYKQSITNHTTVNPNHRTFYVGDDLVSFCYEVEEDK